MASNAYTTTPTKSKWRGIDSCCGSAGLPAGRRHEVGQRAGSRHTHRAEYGDGPMAGLFIACRCIVFGATTPMRRRSRWIRRRCLKPRSKRQLTELNEVIAEQLLPPGFCGSPAAPPPWEMRPRPPFLPRSRNLLWMQGVSSNTSTGWSFHPSGLRCLKFQQSLLTTSELRT
ncbi:hypothetical protein PVAP13_4NG229700 [Panicum virgatum]|uniref:Uncharacterized protein n=1 Tax=Panicum virgatum TaxID=38727 RepID=A0A8T0TC01_PANVG|nr:hypothetical protein PVAP13_4NG229700 [Panicum virgatum]